MSEDVKFTFKLPDSFVEEYKDKKPPFGFPDAAGNSVGEIVFARTYSRKKDDGTKESWTDVCRRITEGTFTIQKNWCKNNRLPWNGNKASASAREFFDRLWNLKFSPPGRGIANMGTHHVINENRSETLQNCSAVSTYDMPKANPAKPFIFLFEASMNGIGVGFDTRGEELGYEIREPKKSSETYVVPDTREGWAHSTGLIINSYLSGNFELPEDFDYSEIRPEGAPIKTLGGVASGPQPLINLHKKLIEIFDSRVGQNLDSRTIVDVANLIGVAVVSGNVRRSALLAMGRSDDEDFINLKNYELNPERQEWGFMSNNSVNAGVLEDLSGIADGIKSNGEPGVIWMDVARQYGRLSDAPDYKDMRAVGFNPCLTGDSLLLNESGYVSFYDAYKNGEPQNILVDSRITYTESKDGEEHPENWKIKHKAGSRAVVEEASEVFLTQKDADIVKISTFEGFDVRLTPDHLVATENGMIPAGDLSIGDKILLTAGSLPQWSVVGREPETVEEIEHALMGLIMGDGRLSADSSAPGKHHKVSIDLWNDDRKLVPVICSWIDTLFEHYGDAIKSDSNRPLSPYYVSNIASKNKVYIQSTFLAKVLDSKYGFGLGTKNVVPKYTMENARSSEAAFLVAGLAFADGAVNKYSKVGSSCIRINQSNKALLQQVQLILLANGIESKIYSRHPAGMRDLPDGNGGLKPYYTQENFDLIVSTNKYEYTKHFGFLGSHKDGLANSLFTKKSRKNPAFTARVVSVEPDGVEDVYCLREPKRRILAANGISMRRCAEQPLESYECCTLADVYLHNAESKEDFLRTLKFAYLYAKTVTLVPTSWAETNAVMQRNRRIGTSLSGIADFSDRNSLHVLQDWVRAGYDEITKYDELYSEWLCIRESIRHTTVKPGGTTGVVAGTSPGAHWTLGGKFFLRRVTFGKNDPLVPVLEDAGYKVEESAYTPDTSVVVEFPVKSEAERSETEVTIWEKAHLAAFMQRHWSDNSVSVTVSYSEDEAQYIEKILHMYAGSLKTVSFLPQGGKYKQMPYEPISEEEYENYRAQVSPVDMAPIYGKKAEEALGESFCNNDSCLIPGAEEKIEEAK